MSKCKCRSVSVQRIFRKNPSQCFREKDPYTRGQWKRNDDERVCRECIQDKATSGTPWQCNNCKVWRAEANFPKKYHRPQCTYYRVCLTCEVRKECAKCGVRQAEAAFGAAAWKARHVDRRVCRGCAHKQRGWWQCHTCYVRKETSQFSTWLARPRRTVSTIDCRRSPPMLRPAGPSSSVAGGWWRRHGPRLRRDKDKQRKGHKRNARRRRRPATRRPPLQHPPRSQLQRHQPCPAQLKFLEQRFTTMFARSALKKLEVPCTLAKSTIVLSAATNSGLCRASFAGARAHTCPTCAMVVFSSKTTGRVRIQHTQPNGKPCPCASWNV